MHYRYLMAGLINVILFHVCRKDAFTLDNGLGTCCPTPMCGLCVYVCVCVCVCVCRQQHQADRRGHASGNLYLRTLVGSGHLSDQSPEPWRSLCSGGVEVWYID